MRIHNLLSVLTLTMALGACAIARPIVDLQDPTNPDPNNYQSDLLECQGLAMYGVSESDEAIDGATKNAAGSIAGNMIMPTPDLASGLAGGMIGGYFAGQRKAERKRMSLIAWCLQARGYSIVNEQEVKATVRNRCRMPVITFDGRAPGEAVEECMVIERQRRIAWRKKWGKDVAVE